MLYTADIYVDTCISCVSTVSGVCMADLHCVFVYALLCPIEVDCSVDGGRHDWRVCTDSAMAS